MRTFLMLCLLLVLCLGVFPTLAQEVTETPSPDVKPIDIVIDEPAPDAESDLAQAFERFITLINSITYMPVAAAFVVVATSLAKRIPGLRIGAAVWAFLFQVAIWVVWVLLRREGVTEEVFTNALDGVTTILAGLVGLIGGSFGAQWIYDKSVQRMVPVLGYSKTPPGSAG